MSRLKANKKILIGLVTAIIVTSVVSYIVLQQDVYNNNHSIINNITDIAYPTITPTYIGILTVPSNIDTWKQATTNNSWPFRYPPNLTEICNEVSCGYLPSDALEGTWGMGYAGVQEGKIKPEEYIHLPTGVDYDDIFIVKRETFQVGNKDGELIVFLYPGFGEVSEYPGIKVNNHDLSMLISIYNVALYVPTENQSFKCGDNGTLLLRAGNYSEEGFDSINFQYETEVKQILATLKFEECSVRTTD